MRRRAIHALLNGRYAALGGYTLGDRAKNLVKIVTAYSLAELLEEPGIGAVAATEIQVWLKEQGHELRGTRDG